MLSINKNNTKTDEKTNEFIDNITIDDELINKMKEMSNNDIGKQLLAYIVNDNTNEFNKFIYHCNVLSNNDNSKNEIKTNIFSKIAFGFGKNKLDLDYILNKKLYGNPAWPLIVVAAHKSNLDIVNTLIKYNV